MIADNKTYFFPSPEDTCSWLHAKGLATQTKDTPDPGEWRCPRRQKKRNRPANRGPTEAQRVEERTQAVAAVSQQNQDRNPFQVLSLEEGMASGSDGSDTICSAIGPESI